MDLWPLLRGEPNILKLTNRLHPNQNQCVHATELISRLKRLGTQFHPTLIIPPSIKTLEQRIHRTRNPSSAATSFIRWRRCNIPKKRNCESATRWILRKESESTPTTR